jgi:hypothetical protein
MPVEAPVMTTLFSSPAIDRFPLRYAGGRVDREEAKGQCGAEAASPPEAAAPSR